MDRPAADEEEPEPRFLLSAGPARADAIAAVLAVLQPAGLIVGVGWDRGSLGLARDHGVAVLVEDDLDLEADGVHLTDASRVAHVRSRIDEESRDRLILGADVGLSRHDAMLAGEEGADYVAFGDRNRSADDAVLDLIAWWRDVTIMPCLAYAGDVETVTKLAGLGTDFIGIGGAFWNHPGGPAAAADAFSAAVANN